MLKAVPTDDAATSVIQTTSHLAWATSAFAFSVGGMRFVSPQGESIDAVLALVVGGAAAYLAMSLSRVPKAVVGATRIALVSGIANGLMLPIVVIACTGGCGATDFWVIGGSTTDRVVAASLGLTVATVATATPWALYWTLRSRHARAWFGESAQACNASGGMWVNDR